MLPLVLVAAIVTEDATPLRAAAKENAARQTLLSPGDWLELRGERQGWLSVYDHRHERPGYVRPSQVRVYPVDETSSRDLAAIVDFLREQPGMESLGIGYVALFLRAAPAGAVGAELFDALGLMAERLGRRASSRWAKPGDLALAGQLEVAESYGVHFKSFEKNGRTRVCYDGEAFRRVLAVPEPGSPPLSRAHAALGLSDPACVDPALAEVQRDELSAWQAGVLEKAGTQKLPPWLANRLRIRLATVRAQVAYVQARKADWKAAASSAGAAEKALMLVDKPELADDDTLALAEAAIRVAAVRWAGEPPGGDYVDRRTVGGSPAPSKSVAIAPGQPPAGDYAARITVGGSPGETCVRFAQLQHCTYAVVWPASVRVAPRGDAIAIAQSPLPGWTEVVLLRRGREPLTLAPAAADPDLGYVEPAGWSPDGTRLLVAREAEITGPLGQPGTLAPFIQRRFQILRADGSVEKQSSKLDNFPSFRRWAAVDWQRSSLTLR
jgi:hypothetical protein